MSDLHTRTSSFWKKRYPNAHTYIGTRVGVFNGRIWWYAIGAVLEKYESAKELILNRLTAIFTEQYCSTVHFRLYMIGASETSAIPTIMFFCVDKEPRKKAKKMVEDSGIMKMLPGFRTGHQATQPGVGSLVRPATRAGRSSDAPLEHMESKHPVWEVYFDRTRPICQTGMPIFVYQSKNRLRQATANTVYYKGSCVFMTVSHIFSETSSDMQVERDDYDSEFDFGSGTEDEYDDTEDLNATSRASISSLEDMSEGQSDINITDIGSSSNMDEDAVMQNDVSDTLPLDTMETMQSTTYLSHGLGEPTMPSDENLELLGSLMQSRTDQDWALIEITNEMVLSSVKLRTTTSTRNRISDASYGSRKVSADTSHGLITGFIPEGSVNMRVPGSTGFEVVYQVNLDSPLSWGDCGTEVIDLKTEELVGHIVASSRTGRIAYIMAAHNVFAASGIQWTVPGPVRFGITTSQSGLFGRMRTQIKQEQQEPHVDNSALKPGFQYGNPLDDWYPTSREKDPIDHFFNEDDWDSMKSSNRTYDESFNIDEIVPSRKRIKSESPMHTGLSSNLDSGYASKNHPDSGFFDRSYSDKIYIDSSLLTRSYQMDGGMTSFDPIKAPEKPLSSSDDTTKKNKAPKQPPTADAESSRRHNTIPTKKTGRGKAGPEPRQTEVPRFRKGDPVSMAQLVGGARVKGTFIINKIQLNKNGHVEYQLTERLTGKVYKNGAWIQERHLRQDTLR